MKRSVGVLLLAFVLTMATPALTTAHPLGNFSINRYSRIEIGADEARLRYVLDLAEIPTLQELRAAGTYGDSVDEAARQRLLSAKTPELAAGARLTVGGVPVTWTVRETSLDLVPGQADLNTLRLGMSLVASAALVDGARIEYRDLNYPGRAGWHEVVLSAGSGVSLLGSTVGSGDVSDELRAYPTDASRPPLDVSSASAVLRLAAAGDAPVTHSSTERTSPVADRLAPSILELGTGRLAGLLKGWRTDSIGAVAAGVLVAVVLGALHALEPGHGKTVVGAYLVGSRGTARQAVLLGVVVTITHTLGVYALAAATLVAAQYVVPERLYPALGLASGLTIIGVGLWGAKAQLTKLLPRLGSSPPTFALATVFPHSGGHAHPHGHDGAHHHSHPGAHDHSHGGAHHSHPMLGADGSQVTLRSLMALGVSGGLVPCPAALVVLLAAVSFHNVGLGALLVAAFSVGLAAVLTGIGLVVVQGGRRLARTRIGNGFQGSALAGALPVVSAAAITLAGFAIVAQALRTFP